MSKTSRPYDARARRRRARAAIPRAVAARRRRDIWPPTTKTQLKRWTRMAAAMAEAFAVGMSGDSAFDVRATIRHTRHRRSAC